MLLLGFVGAGGRRALAWFFRLLLSAERNGNGETGSDERFCHDFHVDPFFRVYDLGTEGVKLETADRVLCGFVPLRVLKSSVLARKARLRGE